ncbi:MAG TPA: glycosyltransferase [Candidatus Binatia bacterium]|jgi:glycosyltransferase involved in cell wall biosynthesis
MNHAIVVIPCYNEAKRLPVNQFMAFDSDRYDTKFIFVNDGSTDSTLEIIESLRARTPCRYFVHNMTRNTGKAEATRAGLLLAFQENPRYVGFWDADLATPLDAINDFCQLLDGNPSIEMIFGARVRLLGRLIQRRAIRHYPGRIFATAASLMLGLSVYDTQCGAKLFRATPQIKLLFNEPFETKWLFDVEIIARLIKARRGTAMPQAEDVIYEFPLHEWRDVPGSKVRPKDFVVAFVELCTIWRRYLR